MSFYNHTVYLILGPYTDLSLTSSFVLCILRSIIHLDIMFNSIFPFKIS